MYRGVGYFQIPEKGVGTFRQQLSGGPPKFCEGMPSMDSAGENAKEGGGGAVIF